MVQRSLRHHAALGSFSASGSSTRPHGGPSRATQGGAALARGRCRETAATGGGATAGGSSALALLRRSRRRAAAQARGRSN